MGLSFQSLAQRRHFLTAILAMTAAVCLRADDKDRDKDDKAPAPVSETTAAPANPLSPAPSSAALPTATAATAAASDGNSTAVTPALPATEMRLLEQFINMPPERITELRKALERIEKMSPAERQALRTHLEVRIQNIRQVRQAIDSDDIEQLTPPQRDVLNQYVMTLFPADAQKILQELRDATTPDQRKKVVAGMLATAATQGIKPRPPAPPPSNRGNQPPGNNRANPRDGRNPKPVTPPANVPGSGTAAPKSQPSSQSQSATTVP